MSGLEISHSYGIPRFKLNKVGKKKRPPAARRRRVELFNPPIGFGSRELSISDQHGSGENDSPRATVSASIKFLCIFPPNRL